MGRNGDIRKLLEKKLHVKQAQLYNLAKPIANSLSIPTADAILVLAAKNQINLHKYGGNLPAGKIEQIRGLLQHVPATAQTALPTTSTSRNRERSVLRQKRVFRVKPRKLATDPILGDTTLNEIKAMVAVYEALYHLENSIRQFIARVLKAKRGNDWWDKVAPKGTRETVEKRTSDDQRHAWHQRRSASAIDYLDLNQLPALVRAAQADFVDAFLPSIEWFQQFIDEVYRSRCVVCHMNPLLQDNVDDVGLKFNRWQQQMNAKLDDLCKLEGEQAPRR